MERFQLLFELDRKFSNLWGLTIRRRVANLVQNFSVSGDFISQKRNGTGNVNDFLW